MRHASGAGGSRIMQVLLISLLWSGWGLIGLWASAPLSGGADVVPWPEARGNRPAVAPTSTAALCSARPAHMCHAAIGASLSLGRLFRSLGRTASVMRPGRDRSPQLAARSCGGRHPGELACPCHHAVRLLEPFAGISSSLPRTRSRASAARLLPSTTTASTREASRKPSIYARSGAASAPPLPAIAMSMSV